jgi:FTR1 family protein
MFESLVVTLREGIEAALAVGIILACLNKTGRGNLARWVYWGIFAAILASIGGAAILSHLNLPDDLLEGVLELCAAVVVGSMVTWMWSHARHLKGEIEQKLASVLTADGATDFKAGLGLFLFTFFIIAREGLETAIFMGAMTVNSNSLLNVMGATIGLTLAVAFGVCMVKGTLHVDIVRFLKVTAVILMVLVVQLVIGGVHDLSEQGLIHMTARQMALIGPLVKNNVFFIMSVLALPLIVMLVPGRAQQQAAKEIESLSGAERRLRLAQRGRERAYRLLTTATGVVIMSCLMISHVYSSTPRTIDAPHLLTADHGVVTIDTHDLADGKMHRYGVASGPSVVRFIAVNKSDGQPAVALDECEMCGAIGYVQNTEGLMCLNCTAQINIDSLGMRGGCNPMPLDKDAVKVDGHGIHLQMAALEQHQADFHATSSVANETRVTCPVCGMSMLVSEASEHYEYQGKTYYFCRMGKCNDEFKAHPDKYDRAPAAAVAP